MSMQTLYSFSTAVQVSMKAVLAALVLCCQTNLIQAADNAAAIPLGCVVFKRAVDAGATFVEYRSFKDFGTTIVVINTTGDEARVFGYYEPIFIPYPSDKAADRQKTLSLLQLARKTYPDMTRRLALVEKAWAEAPVRTVPANPGSPPAKLNAGTEIVTLSGKKYTGATVTRMEPDTLTISHDAGVTRIPFLDLSEEARRKYGYVPKKAAEFVAAKAPDLAATAQAQEQTAEQRRLDNASVFVDGSILQVLDGGIRFQGLAYRMISEQGKAKLKLLYRTRPIFIVGSFDNAVDGNHWKGQIWPAGVFSYESVGAGTKTIERWATTRDDATLLREDSLFK